MSFLRVPTKVFPVSWSCSSSTSFPPESRAYASGVDGAAGGLLEGVLLDRLDRLALGEDVARRVVRERDVDRVEDGGDLERHEEDEPRDEELSGHEAIPGHHVDRIDPGSRHEQDDEGGPLVVVGQHGRSPDRECVEQAEEDDLDDEPGRAGEEGDAASDPRGPEDRLDVRRCRSGSRRHEAPCGSDPRAERRPVSRAPSVRYESADLVGDVAGSRDEGGPGLDGTCASRRLDPRPAEIGPD